MENTCKFGELNTIDTKQKVICTRFISTRHNKCIRNQNDCMYYELKVIDFDAKFFMSEQK